MHIVTTGIWMFLSPCATPRYVTTSHNAVTLLRYMTFQTSVPILILAPKWLTCNVTDSWLHSGNPREQCVQRHDKSYFKLHKQQSAPDRETVFTWVFPSSTKRLLLLLRGKWARNHKITYVMQLSPHFLVVTFKPKRLKSVCMQRLLGDWLKSREMCPCVNYVQYRGKQRARGSLVVKALRYKPAGRGFDSRWCHWNFSVT